MLTTEDWLARAREGKDVASCLAQGERAARWPDDWLGLAAAWLDSGDVAAARRCVGTALERAQGEHWPCRRAAEFLLTRLGDRAAAGAALGWIEARLLSPPSYMPTQTYQWVLLARAYQEVLGDTESVHRCLASAATGASQPKDLEALAEGYVEFRGDLEEARGLLERAERLSLERGDYRELWSIALKWSESLHDKERARSLLELATTGTSDIQTLTALTIAWRSMFQDEDALRGALVRGETLARTLEDWLVLAEGYRDGGDSSREGTWDPVGVQRCLEAALAAEPAPSDPQREQLAVAFRRWLGDEARAAQLAPTMRSLESEAVPWRHFEGWEARDPRALLHRLRTRLRPEDLTAMANADYGSGAGKHHQALLEIQATGTFPLPLPWEPREVLELTRWTRGADTPHVRRAFACTVLALDVVLPISQQMGELEDSLAPLLESAWALGLDAELEQLLVWLADVMEPAAGYAWPLFALVLTLARRAPGDPRLGPLVAAFEAVEPEASDPHPDFGALLCATGNERYRDLWHELATEVLDPARGLPPHLEQLARRIR
ncbi:hypothetical protein BO221_49290 [Archangium sp. Cb G35]|uniref:hypothetical protein n=1 Tax=Archangium sp. Cb G35 TaxID=1920190 RepID=UPI000935C4AB|nr:hypothetical protein [Archangium sp. Cb G35]OJT16622.1 hypothetical protein BO221_49290 [Archangium sp. Cb G35]